MEKQINQNLEALDFEIAKFNRFTKKVNSFKIWNAIFAMIVAMLCGGLIAFYSVIFYQKSEESSINSLLHKNGIKVINTKTYIKIGVDKRISKISPNQKFTVIKIEKGQ